MPPVFLGHADEPPPCRHPPRTDEALALLLVMVVMAIPVVVWVVMSGTSVKTKKKTRRLAKTVVVAFCLVVTELALVAVVAADCVVP